ncbi:hypothetical protein AYL99_01748 [Fonsecaea erecta]|uniref:Uncharacterized protein n=1 Tax=Fonsecaea erecta TaxID=1367422 RepID=A0A179A2M0_9EURO|nr:hypothetical protein AYL99_01748 [Fonsecaea erecta]OAP65776.1 hypothetical protein AYL99_01748 [Fonsecaea erecta]
MVVFNKLAVACVLINSLAAAAPTSTPDSHAETVACMGLGCTNPEQRHPYVGGITHMEGSNVFPLSDEKVDELAKRGVPEVVAPDAPKTLVKNSIVKKPLEQLFVAESEGPDQGKRDRQKQLEQLGQLEQPWGEESQSLEHGKRALQKQLEQDVEEEKDGATALTSNSPLHRFRTYDMGESTQPGTTAGNPLLEAEDRLVNGLKHAVAGWAREHGRH